jgi:hypothetical protein
MQLHGFLCPYSLKGRPLTAIKHRLPHGCDV